MSTPVTLSPTALADLAAQIAFIEKSLGIDPVPGQDAAAFAERLAALRNVYLDAQLQSLAEDLKGSLAYAGDLFDQSAQGSGAIAQLYSDALQQRMKNQADALEQSLDVQQQINRQRTDLGTALLRALGDPEAAATPTAPSPVPHRQPPTPQSNPGGPFRALSRPSAGLPMGLDIWLR